MTKTMARVTAATRVWKTISHRAGNPAAMLTPTHEMTAARTSSTATGLEAYRSTLDSHRLTGDLDGSPGEAGSATVPGGHGITSRPASWRAHPGPSLTGRAGHVSWRSRTTPRGSWVTRSRCACAGRPRRL